MKNIFAFFSVILIIACHSPAPVALTVEGTFEHANGKKIMLAELPFTNPKRLVLDSATLDNSGVFKLTTIQNEEGMYQLFIENGPGILLINDTTNIVVHADVDSLGKYEVENSRASKSIKSLYAQVNILQEKAVMLNAKADSISKITKMPDSLKAPYHRASATINKAIDNLLTTYLDLEKNGTALWFGLGIASHYYDKEKWALALEKALPNHSRHTGLNLMKVSLTAAQQQQMSGLSLIGKPVPNIILPDTSGKMLSVSSFKGKWLLVDFWASWCAPCRVENPNLLAAYNQFKSKNFAILGISLDKEKNAWTNAITKDSLSWPQVSDLQQWESKAVEVFGFQAIPFNILVDTAGNTIAVNLRGALLQQKLKELLVK